MAAIDAVSDPGPDPGADPVLTAGSVADGSGNVFVEGDNLDVLARLADASYDCVYLDPPYNTDSLFAYRDSFRGASGGRAGRHDAWTAMMRPRLREARRVLAPTGALWCSIDDHEMPRLRLLLDEIFGEDNFLAQVVVSLNPKGRQLGRGFATSHEYVVVYARDAASCVLDASSPSLVDPDDFPLEAPDGRRYRHLPLRNTNTKFNPATAPTLAFAAYGDPDTGRVAPEPFEGGVEIWPVFGSGAPAVWRWSAALMAERAEDLVCRRITGRLGPRIDVFQRDWLDRSHHGARRKKLRTVWLAAEIGSTDTAVAEVKALVGQVFESPKPTGLILRILETMPHDARVLDFFAGSGTTGHAVALANAADGGRRTCLSVQSAEQVRAGSHAQRAGFATVADITRARLRAVAEAVGGEYVERSLADLGEAR